MNAETFYFSRFFARLIDLLLIGLIIQLFENFTSSLTINPLVWFVVYNLVVAVLGGSSLGKYSLSLAVQSEFKGLRQALTLAMREMLLLILFPVLILNVLCVASHPLHDRLSKTKVVRHGS